jgi:uncharacterized membrane protein
MQPDITPHTDKRRHLSDGDIEAIVEALAVRQAHKCMLSVTAEQVEAAVRFHGHIEGLLSETGSTIRKTVIVTGVSGLIALLVLGVYAKMKQVVTGAP